MAHTGRVRSRRGARLLPYLVCAQQRGPWWVAGDYDERRAMELVRRYFGPIPSGQGSRPSVVPRRRSGPPHRRIVVPEGGAARAALLRLVHGPRFFHEDEPALDMLSEILSDGTELAPLSPPGLRGPDGIRRQRLSLFARIRRPHRGGGDGAAAGVPCPGCASRWDGELTRMADEGTDRRGVAAGEGGNPGRLPGGARAARDQGRPARALRGPLLGTPGSCRSTGSATGE